ncbi:HIT domain-containing protein [Candidatus Pacearchaeota archaeon]|nr:HIT domain-containing protein [Candidatus Pacearchaeota archaeon]
MKDCIFCKIVNGELPSVKIWEDKDFIAVLDPNPNTKGMTLIIPKKHYDSYIFDDSDEFCKNIIIASKRVAKLLEKGLNVKRVAMVMEGMGINHAHIKLYPLYGFNAKFEEMWAKDKVFFNKYEGYISTQLGPKVSIDELKKLADGLKKNLKP